MSQSQGNRKQRRHVVKEQSDRRITMAVNAPKHGLLRAHEKAKGSVDAATDLELLYNGVCGLLHALGYDKSPELMIGSMSSTINRFTPELRLQIARAIVAGTHMFITQDEADEWKIHLRQTYEPLVPPDQAEQARREEVRSRSGLVLP